LNYRFGTTLNRKELGDFVIDFWVAIIWESCAKVTRLPRFLTVGMIYMNEVSANWVGL
jgi:hypothetical protein